MGLRLTRNGIRNALCGFISAYGFFAMICFFYLQQRWNEVAPHLPDVRHGLIVPHNEHGWITYFSAFQSTSCTLLFATGFPLAIVGLLVGPKKNMVRTCNKTHFSARWDRDDPAGLWPIGTACGVCAAPIIVFLIGPSFVTWLNAAGIII